MMDPIGYGVLTVLADRHRTDKGSLNHHFTDFYEPFLRPIRLDVRRVLEVGVGNGASLRMWLDYFPSARVFGIDLTFRNVSPPLSTERVMLCEADQAKRNELTLALKMLGGGQFDLVVEDGGHSMEQQQVTLACLLPHVAVGGYYILEDLHTSCGEHTFTSTTLALIEHLQGGPPPSLVHLTKDELDAVRALASDVWVFGRGGSITAVIRRSKDIHYMSNF